MKKLLSTVLISALSLPIMAQAQAPAFPGAEGHGRYTTGGRGGKIVHVTNLNNSGAGSFRQAVSGSEKKIVVFDVAGVIPLQSDLTIGANTTVLGQTAPAPGITLRYYTLQPSSNCVIRFIRVRRGQEKDVNDGADAIWNRHLTGVIIDHCSFSWSIDEVASFYDNNNFTLQWSTIGESLNNAGHDKGAHGYGGIWGGKLASFHHNLICHVNNRSPRFNGARYNWSGYTSNKLYNEYQWANTLQAENVDFRNCVIYNCGNGCYGGPGGGQVNIVNNYYKSGPAATTSRVTQVTVAASGNSGDDPTFLNMSSRYYINGNQMNSTANFNGWSNISYDSGTYLIDNEHWTPDPNHYNGENVTYKKNTSGVDCVRIRMDAPAPTGEVTTHTAQQAYNKVLAYSGASLHSDDVDQRYFTEAKNGTATYSGSVTNKKGRIDLVSDVNGYTETNFGTGSREAGFDTDKDGMPDVWETANGLNPNDATDGLTTTLDPAGFYTNLEVYANSLVQDIMLQGNSNATTAAKEYYPAYKKEDGTEVAAINTLGLNIGDEGGNTPAIEAKTYSVSFGNAQDNEEPAGFFSYSEKHNFNTKFAGIYNGTEFKNGLKMEGATTIEFTTEAVGTVTIIQSTWSNYTIKLDNTELDVASATTPAGSTGVRVYKEAIASGSHRISRGNGESGILYIEVNTSGTTAISELPFHNTTEGAAYNLSGQAVSTNYRGIIIKNGRKYIAR